jgi:hypothetical protein
MELDAAWTSAGLIAKMATLWSLLRVHQESKSKNLGEIG